MIAARSFGHAEDANGKVKALREDDEYEWLISHAIHHVESVIAVS